MKKNKKFIKPSVSLQECGTQANILASSPIQLKLGGGPTVTSEGGVYAKSSRLQF